MSNTIKFGAIFGFDPEALPLCPGWGDGEPPTRIRCVDRSPSDVVWFEALDGPARGVVQSVQRSQLRPDPVTAPEPEPTPPPADEFLVSEFTVRRVIGWVAQRLTDSHRGDVTAFGWDGHILTIHVERCPAATMHDQDPADVVVLRITSDPRLTPDGLLVWAATATVDDRTTFPVRVTWRPERTGAVQ